MAIHVGKWFAEFQKRVATIEQIARYSAKCMLDTTSYSIRVRAWDPDNLVHASELVGFEDLQSASDPVSHLLAAWQRAARRLDENRAAIAPPVQQPAELCREDLYRAGWTYRQNAKGEIELQAPDTKETGQAVFRQQYESKITRLNNGQTLKVTGGMGGGSGGGGTVIVHGITMGGQKTNVVADPDCPVDAPYLTKDLKLANPVWIAQQQQAPTDPLDVEYDGVTLRLLLEQEEMRQLTERPRSQFEPFTLAQRAAISAHWSAELRARVDAAKQKEREQVVSEYEEDRP